MAYLGDSSSQGELVGRLSYRSWSEALRRIFRESFTDQIHAVGNGDLKSEVKAIYQYFEDNQEADTTSLEEVEDVEYLAEKLGCNFKKVEDIEDKKEQVYYLAKSYVQKAYYEITKHKNELFGTAVQKARSRSTEGPGQDRKSSELNTRTKEVMSGHEERQLLEQEDSRERAFCLQSNVDLGNLRCYIAPRHTFFRTETFQEIKHKIIEEKQKILHIYGMSSGGKSQIILSVCKELDLNYPGYLIRHWQCCPNGGVLLRGLQTFAQKLQRCLPSVISQEAATEISNDLHELHVRSFVKMLHAIRFDTLLVMEDVADGTEKHLVRSLITELETIDAPNVQLVIVTQKLEALYPVGDIDGISTHQYVTTKVSGFKISEAIDFLHSTPQDEKVVTKLAEELAYSPLRLFLAKTFCVKFGISYEEYYNGLGTDEDFIKKEKEILQEHPELGKHTYEVIMRVLKPKDPANEDEHMQFEVMKMMSFLNNSSIPDILLGAFLRNVRDFETVANEQRQVEYLLHRLKENCDLSIRSPIDEPKKFGQQTVTIHNDILSAVRLGLDMQERRKIAIEVLQCVISLVGKENRFRTDNVFLFDMISHMHQVADFAVQLIEGDFNPREPKPEDFDIQICLSRLYEVLGFATTQTSGMTKDENFGKATDYLWSIACYYTGTSILKSVFGKRKASDKLHAVPHYDVGKNPVETAKKMYKKLREASTKIPVESVRKSCTRFFPITEKLLKDMKVQIDGKQIDFEGMEKDLNGKGHLKEEHVAELQENGAILTSKKLRSVYLTECVASIMHTRGRQVLYLKESISTEEQHRYEWYTDVGLELCKCLSNDTHIRTIFEYIIQANNKLPRMLHSRQNETEAQFLLRIQNSRKLATELDAFHGDFYEHGVYKLVSGTPYTIMNTLKYLVKANTKIYKRSEVADRYAIQTALSECEQLYQMAKEYASKFVVASNCMIHVGKYYAAIKEYGKALQAIEDGFEYKGSGINSTSNENVNGYAWALYNYGRALYASGGDATNFGFHMGRFFKLYEVLEIPNRWREDLDEVKMRVKSLSGCKTPE